MSNNRTKGVGCLGLIVLLLLITLKLTHVIAWPWWLVLAPLWGGAALTVGALVVIVVGGFALAALMVAWEDWRKKRQAARRARQRASEMMECTRCHARKHVNEFASPDICCDCWDKPWNGRKP